MRIIISSLIFIVLAVLNYIYGNAISVFLSICFAASVWYFISFIGFEDRLTREVRKSAQGGQAAQAVMKKASQMSRKQRALASFFLMTIVFIAAVICIRITSAPHGKQAYFFNNDHHALAHKYTYFSQPLALQLQSDQESAFDSHHVERYIQLVPAADHVVLNTKDFLHPVFKKNSEDKFTLINKVYAPEIRNQFSIRHPHAEITIHLEEKKSLWQRLTRGRAQVLYHVYVRYLPRVYGEDNHSGNWISDTLSFHGPYLQQGMNIYNLLFDKEYIDEPDNESLLVLQEILHPLSQSYLIAEHSKDEDVYYFFPGEDFFSQGLSLSIEGQPATQKTDLSIELNDGDELYIGFNNKREKIRISAVNTEINSHSFKWALEYDHAPYYWLSVPESSNFWHNKVSYFMTNDFDQVIDYPQNELFYFNNYGLKTKETFAGVFQFMIDNTRQPLLNQLRDLKNTASKGLYLDSDKNGVTFGFELRDFSENGFSFNKMLVYAAVIYFSFLAFLLLFPGKNLGRIEGVIFVVIYALFILRMIMYWRLATFPPVENISKHELENTLLNFDFNLGVQLPVPLTLIWLIGFLVVLAVVRTYKDIVKARLHRMFSSVSRSRDLSDHKTFIAIMGGLLVLYYLNDKLLGIEPLTRILAIIAPVTFYILYSIRSNSVFSLEQKWADVKDPAWKRELKAYFYYLVNNPAFVPSMITLIYLGITDRGFAVLFFLFLLLKNILLNFLKRSYDSSATSFGKMIFKPNNFWIYGIIALVVYMIILSVKSLFYHALQNYIWVGGVLLVLIWLFIILFFREQKKLFKISSGFLLLYIILMSVPFTRNHIDHFVISQIKHVQYRMSIIYQPISELLLENEYSSFSTRKIIETAENQWFINSYISKAYDPAMTLNLRQYNKVGVDYNTQTRDVVLARFVISEMGDFTMYVILLLMVLPLVLYLVGFRFNDKDRNSFKIDPHTYVGIVPLVLLFTICLFVWLTSTNRFVFFGQDFPFLSLTSRTSMVLPLILLAIVLLSSPRIHIAEKVSLQKGFSKYILFIGMIAFFALVTVQPNTLNTQNFSVIVHKTQDKIDHELNAYLSSVQDSLSAAIPAYSYIQMIQALKDDASFQGFLNDSLDDPYTTSIFNKLMNTPYTAFEVNSPIYIQYDGYRYHALYNQNFYLELPSIDNNNVWRGNIVEDLGSTGKAILTYGGEQVQVSVPYFRNDVVNHIHLAVIPQSWLADHAYHIGIVEVVKGSGNNTSVSVYKDISKSFTQRSRSFAGTLHANEVLSVKNASNNFNVSLSNAAPSYAINKWVNGRYRILYPHRPKSLWIYSFAHGIRSVKTTTQTYHEDLGISLDFKLNKAVENIIHQGFRDKKKIKKFKFSVITADGDGHIRLMQDFVSNRKEIDPNDNYSLYQLRQKQFFYSNIRNERDQWGEANLLNMQLGPGSSIKPLTASVVASQVNAGWEFLSMDPPVQQEYNHYAGFRLIKPWKREEYYMADISLAKYIETSSNFYQSAIMFLGSYPKEAFVTEKGASLANVLSPAGGGAFPSFNFLGKKYGFRPYSRGADSWPVTNVNDSKKSYFGNENSLLANGFEVNANLITKDKDKNSPHYGALGRINVIDTSDFDILREVGNAYFLWSMPEENSFFQKLRAPNEIHQNFNIGMKTTTLGGYPYQLSSFKMLEMYASLFTQNRNYRLHLNNETTLPHENWYVDETWGGQSRFNAFLSQNIFTGMQNVIFGGSGTLRRMAGLKALYPGYFFYAKTGTINEQGSGELSSRRLVIAVSDKDLTQAENVGKGKVYLIFFMIDRNKDFDWAMINNIVEEIMKSSSLHHYFNS